MIEDRQNLLDIWNNLSLHEQTVLLITFGYQISFISAMQVSEEMLWVSHQDIIRPAMESIFDQKHTAHGYTKLEKRLLIHRKPLHQRSKKSEIDIRLSREGWRLLMYVMQETDLLSKASAEAISIAKRDDDDSEHKDHGSLSQSQKTWRQFTERQQDFLVAATVVVNWQKQVYEKHPDNFHLINPSFGMLFGDNQTIQPWQWFDGGHNSPILHLLLKHDPNFDPTDSNTIYRINGKGFNSTWRFFENRGYIGSSYGLSAKSYYVTQQTFNLLDLLMKQNTLSNLHEEMRQRAWSAQIVDVVEAQILKPDEETD